MVSYLGDGADDGHEREKGLLEIHDGDNDDRCIMRCESMPQLGPAGDGLIVVFEIMVERERRKRVEANEGMMEDDEGRSAYEIWPLCLAFKTSSPITSTT